MRLRIQHITRYVYDEPVSLGTHVVRLWHAPHLASRVMTWNLEVRPEAIVRWQHDAWANRIAHVDFGQRADIRSLELQVDAAVELIPINPFDFRLDERCRDLPFDWPPELLADFAPFLRQDDISDPVREWVRRSPPEGYVVDWLVRLNQRVAEDVNYVIRNEPGIQTPEETLSLARGSCRDSAWLLVHALRASGLAARFVSGYLIQLEDEGNLPEEPRGMDRDVVDLHAWAEVFLPGAGWVGLDGTSGLLCAEGHIPLATAVNPELAAPLTGTSSARAASFEFEMNVARIGHEPSPRRPYDDATWASLLRSGEETDRRLVAAGVTLTSGGEPTWTSRRFPRLPEWQTEALGDTKWQQGLVFADQIRERLAPGGLVLRRTGKHYPGESLPRWALDVLWRLDGEPLWRDGALLQGWADAEAAATLPKAEQFARTLMEKLDLQGEPQPAWEDPWVAITSEAMLPADVDPLAAGADDPEERQRLAAQLRRGLDQQVGFVIPIQWQQGRWRTQRWQFRRERLYLVPGDSPLGLRLPLDRLPGAPAFFAEYDPWSPEGPLQGDLPAAGRVMQDHSAATVAHADADASGVPAGPATQVRTALCVEPRDGVLHVFLPPVETLPGWVDLVAAVEDAASSAGLPVRLEGYGPPDDPRVRRCAVTPDPGVLEVNLPVTESLAEYTSWMEALGEAAVHSGLSTERYQLDGRAAGSGGGNHLTLGGPHPDESVFLRRPEVLAGLVRLCQQHPSLSYFFSGLFVGPTSQAPRLDEARDEVLAEVELALSQLSRGGDPPMPWFIDRLLRNLLVDLTGNTHRTEICIDKLFNPGSTAGRLGIVELRAFEMPPNERMCVAQMWLVRAIVLRLLEQPLDTPLVRWGSRLHDRFLLPYFLWEDLMDVLDWLRAGGLDADPEWFRPFLEYRFPVAGRIQADGVMLEVRPALEPWPVLGEEPVGGGVARHVDSSLDRVEVRARGLLPERHVVAVNGIRLPMAETGDDGLLVAGVRFRAWQPPHCLQPHIGIHHPLRIDVLDTWSRRSLAGCAHHVWHPEGRAFDEPPLTAFEAAARRAMRFSALTHQPWPVDPVEPTWHPPAAVTLDLRWSGSDRRMPWSNGAGES